MSDGPRDAWAARGIGITAAIAAVAIVVGFLLLPLAGSSASGIWDTICSAAGLIRQAPDAGPIQQASYPTTQVAVVPQMLHGAGADAIGTGATLALRCSMCHGARGLSEAEAPNLAGQYAVAIYKQLVDFKTGARASAVMTPLVANLSDTDMRDLAVYYAYLPRVAGAAPGDPPPIVAHGAPMRGIAPCGACHGTIDHKAAATWLGGQPLAYLHAQLAAFAAGTRRNDVDAQMRNIAGGMTAAEIDAAAQFFAQHP